MNDPISRAELFDELNRQGVPYNAEVNMVINGMPSAQQWIPCSERLPEEETTYLVTFASGQVGISSWHKSTKHNRGFDNVMQAVLEKGSITIYGVVAWMLLPEPWRGEQP